MRIDFRISTALLALGLLGGCAATTIQLPTVSAPVFREGARARSVDVVTDIETVRDIAVSDGRVYAATDAGLYAFESGRGQRMDLPELGADVRSVASSGDALVVASATGVFTLYSGTAGFLGEPQVGSIVAVRTVGDFTYACGTEGLARATSSTDFERFGDSAQCTGLFPSPQGQLWVGTTRGAWFVDGDVITEHAEGRGLPAPWVRSVVPMPEGQAFALVQDVTESHLAYYDGLRWYGYTIDGFSEPVVGLARGTGGNLWLFGEGYAFSIDDATRAQGVRLTVLSRGDRLQTLSYRGDGGPATPPRDAANARPTSRLAAVPPNHPTLDAPAWVVSPIGAVGAQTYLVRDLGDTTYVADRNRGIVPVSSQGPGEALRTRSLVASRDLQVASDSRGDTWLLTEQGVVARMSASGFLQRVAAPEGVTLGALASASRGLYVAGAAPGNVARVYRREGDAWTLIAEPTLFAPAAAAADAPAPEAGVVDPEAGDVADSDALELVGTPLMGVRDDETIWLGVRVRANTESGGRLRGVAVFRPGGGSVVYHHANADPATDGEGALRMPDDFGNIDLDQPEMAWFSTLVGAVRIGNHQAVTFGEARGVRGEVVSDVMVGSQNKVWVAAAEGPGYYFQQSFEFRMPQAVRDARPIGLAMDASGAVWGAGPNGLVRYADENWTLYGEAEGLPTIQFVDIEADAAGRLWVLGRDQVVVLGPPASPPPAE